MDQYTIVHGQKKKKFNNHVVVEVIVVRLGFLFISYSSWSWGLIYIYAAGLQMVLAEQSASVATVLWLKPSRPPSSELLKLSFG